MAKKKSKQRSGKANKPAAPKMVKQSAPDEPDTAETETSAAETTPDGGGDGQAKGDAEAKPKNGKTAPEKSTTKDSDAKGAESEGKEAKPKKTEGKGSKAEQAATADKDAKGSGTKKNDKARPGQKAKSGKSGSDSVFGKGSQKSRPGGKSRPAGKPGKGKKKGRKSSAPKNPLPWGMITLVTGLVIVVAGLIAVPFLFLPDSPDSDEPIDGVADYYVEEAAWVEESSHIDGRIEYELSPPAGGNHNSLWTTCNGVVYESPVPNEHAVHSLEHGAIWFTYDPEAVTEEQISSLESKVTGIDYTFMTPYPGQSSPIMLTAWGFQLEVDSTDDERITAFTSKYRLTASREPGAACSGGTDVTGDTPISAPGMEG